MCFFNGAAGHLKRQRWHLACSRCDKRSEMGGLPDVPTIGEFVPGYEADSWFGVVAPKGTPTDIVNELNDKINAIVTDSKMKVQLIGLGATPKSMTPTEFGKLIADYTEKWAKVIKLAGIKPE